MDCDYECPRCHNFFPLQNKIIHDIRCTEEKPMPLDINFQIKQNTNKGQQTSVLNETEKNEQESPEIVNLNKNDHLLYIQVNIYHIFRSDKYFDHQIYFLEE